MKKESEDVKGDKKMKKESGDVRGDGMNRKIGDKIMEKYEEKMKKISEKLKEVRIMEVKEKMEDIESESRSIIENKKVSEKKIK